MRILICLIFLLSNTSLVSAKTDIDSYPKSMPIPIDVLDANPHLSDLKISPDGQYISALIFDDNNKHIDLIDRRTKKHYTVINLSFQDDLSGYEWIDNQRILIGVERGKSHSDYIVSLSVKNKKLTAKSHGIPFDFGYVVDILPEQPDKVLYARMINPYDGFHLYLASIEQLLAGNVTQKQEIKKPVGKAVAYIYDRASNHLIAMLYDKDSKTMTFKYRGIGKGHWQSLFTLKKSSYTFKPVGFIGPRRLAVLSNKGQDKVALQVFNINTKKLEKVIFEHPRYDLINAKLGTNGSVKSVSFVEHGRLTHLYISSHKDVIAEFVKLQYPGKQYFVVASNQSQHLQAVRIFSSSNPGGYYLFDQQKRSLTLIGRVYPKLDHYQLYDSELLQVKTDQNYKIEGYLTRPTTYDNGVLLVMPHGGPIGIREYDDFDSQVQYFVSRGFSVLRVNFRGSSGFGRRFEQSGVGQFGKAIEMDITRAVQMVNQKYAYKRMCSIGASYGGYSAVMLAMEHPKDYQCVVAEYGIYDLPLLFNGSNLQTQEEQRERVAKVVGPMRDSLFDVSPLYHAKKLQAPIFLIAGTEDHIAGFEQSSRFYYVLKKLGKNVQRAFFPGVGHGQRTYNGDYKEIAAVYQFLRHQLQLPLLLEHYPDNDYKLTLATEYMRIADDYNFNQIPAKDVKQAFHYYQMAANLGNARGMNNLASFYQEAVATEQDMNKALYWYMQASQHGFAKASYHLAEMYHNGDVIKNDDRKAFHYYKIAFQQHYYGKVLLDLARSYCLGQGTKANSQQCIHFLDLEAYKQDLELRKQNHIDDDVMRARKEIVADILLSPHLIKPLRRAVNQFVDKIYKVQSLPVTISIKGYGTGEEYQQFNVKRVNDIITQSYVYSTRIKSSGDKIPASAGQKFGIEFNVQAIQPVNKQLQLALLCQFVRIDKYGKKHVEDASLLYGDEHRWAAFHTLKKDELQPSDWQLTLFSMDGKPLYKKLFHLIKKTPQTTRKSA